MDSEISRKMTKKNFSLVKLLGITQKNEKRKVLIFGQGRTGSTLLEDLIESTGDFKAHGELLNTDWYSGANALEELIDKSESCEKHFICHVKVYQLTRDACPPIDAKEFIDSLVKRGWKIIYLKRRNQIGLALSSIVARERNIYHSEEQLPNIKINLDFDVFISHIEYLSQWYKQEKEALSDVDYHEVIYEDNLLNRVNHQRTIDNILNYLGLPTKMAESRHKKTNHQNLSNLILNYADIKNKVENTVWAKEFEDLEKSMAEFNTIKKNS